MIEVPASTRRPGNAPAVALSLDALRSSAGARRWAGSAGALRQVVSQQELPLPAGLIFHSGRCGSTLLANMLAVHPSLRVLNEPDVVNRLLMTGLADESSLRTLARAFARGMPAEGRVVVKASSWNVLDASSVLAALPGVPAVFLWRRATDVVASCLHRAPGWAEHSQTRRWLARRLGCPEHRPAEFYARAWRAATEAGLELARSAADRVRVIGYDELRAGPVGVATEVAAWFGAPTGDALAGAMQATARAYSKDSTGRAVFDPDGAHARPSLPAGDLALVARLTAGIG